MTDTPPATTRPRHPGLLLRFLLPVLLAHGLLLASLPYWPAQDPAGSRGVRIELAPVVTDQAADTATATPAGTTRPAATGTVPQPAAVTPVPTPTAHDTGTGQPSGHAATSKPASPTRATAQGNDAIAQATPPAAAATAPPPTSATREHTTATTTTVTTAVTAATGQDHDAAAPAAGATTTTGDTDAWRDPYRSALRAALARHHHYPPRARRFGLSGVVQVAFSIRRDGRFADIRIQHSSDVELLDQAALDTVRRLGHFRPLPADYSDDSWAVSVPLVYRLN